MAAELATISPSMDRSEPLQRDLQDNAATAPAMRLKPSVSSSMEMA
jgi:hypothetical protein